MTDLIPGRVQAGIDACRPFPHVRSGAVRALAVMSPARSRRFRTCRPWRDDPGLDINGRDGHRCRRAKTPPAIVERLNREINAGLEDTSPKARYADVGAVPIT